MANKKFQIQYVLSPKQLKDNLDIFQKINEKYKIFPDKLIKYLSDNDFFNAPATNMLNLFNCCLGGLLDHTIRVTKYATNINKILPDNLKINKDSIFRVCFLHGIGKTNLYKENDSKWHKENLGQMYVFTDEQVSMKVGEKSAYLSMKYGIELTEEEYQAIINSSKDLSEDDQAKWYSDILTVILRQGIELAIIEEKQLWKELNKN